MAFYPNRKSNNLTSSISVLAITIGLVAGQSATQKSLAQFSNSPAPAGVTSINGVGSSTVNALFVGTGTTSPLAPKGSWFNTYGVGNPSTLNPPGPVNPFITFRYASVGSGAGVDNFLCRTVPLSSPTINTPISFAATDKFYDVVDGPLCPPLFPPIPFPKYVEVPVISVGIALVYNPSGLNIPAGGIKFSRATYFGILNGTIRNWNDARIRADNGGAIISQNKPIVGVYRSDSSDTTLTLTSHLKAAIFGPQPNPWIRGVGEASTNTGTLPPPVGTVIWPSNFTGASGGGGVATKIKTTAGAIGYVDSATRLANSLQAAVLQNKAGVYTPISSTSISNAFVGATDQDPNPRRIKIVVTDPTAANAYPIVTASYLLFYDQYADVKAANGIKGFINWALGVSPVVNAESNPNTIAIARGYAPLPDAIKTQARNVVNTYVDTLLNP